MPKVKQDPYGPAALRQRIKSLSVSSSPEIVEAMIQSLGVLAVQNRQVGMLADIVEAQAGVIRDLCFTIEKMLVEHEALESKYNNLSNRLPI